MLFTIRVHRSRLRALRGEPAAARDLAASIRSMDAAFQHYKALPRLRDAVLACLDESGDR